MTTPFDSTIFFEDEFFGTQTVEIQSKSVTAIVFDDLDPEKRGQLLNRPGHWGQFYFKVSDIDKPNPADTFTIGSVVWRVDSATETGDAYEVLAVSKQRMHP